MYKKLILLVILFFCLKPCFCKNVPPTIFNFSSKTLGKFSIELDSSDIKIIIPNQNLVVLSKYPNKNYIAYNQKTKIYINLPINNMKIGIQINNLELQGMLKDRNPDKLISSKLKNLEICQNFYFTGEHKNTITKISNRTANRSNIEKIDVLTAKDFKINSNIAFILKNLFGYPTTTQLPIGLEYFTTDRYNRKNSLITLIDYKELKPNRQEFDLPPNYKLAKNQQAIFIDDFANSIIKDLTNDMTK